LSEGRARPFVAVVSSPCCPNSPRRSKEQRSRLGVVSFSSTRLPCENSALEEGRREKSVCGASTSTGLPLDTEGTSPKIRADDSRTNNEPGSSVAASPAAIPTCDWGSVDLGVAADSPEIHRGDQELPCLCVWDVTAMSSSTCGGCTDICVACLGLTLPLEELLFEINGMCAWKLESGELV